MPLLNMAPHNVEKSGTQMLTPIATERSKEDLPSGKQGEPVEEIELRRDDSSKSGVPAESRDQLSNTFKTKLLISDSNATLTKFNDNSLKDEARSTMVFRPPSFQSRAVDRAVQVSGCQER